MKNAYKKPMVTVMSKALVSNAKKQSCSGCGGKCHRGSD